MEEKGNQTGASGVLLWGGVGHWFGADQTPSGEAQKVPSLKPEGDARWGAVRSFTIKVVDGQCPARENVCPEGLGRGSSAPAPAPLTYWAGKFGVGGHVEHCRAFSSLYPLDASSTASCDKDNFSGYGRVPPGG